MFRLRELSQDPLNVRRRELYAERMADPYLAERFRQAKALTEAKRRQDPERYQALLEHHRAANARYRAAHPERVREQRRSAYVKFHEENTGLLPLAKATGNLLALRMPREPYRRWLVAYSKLMGFKDAADLSQDLGINERNTRRVLGREEGHVIYDIVDRALINARLTVKLSVCGVVTFVFDIGDLYPVELGAL